MIFVLVQLTELTNDLDTQQQPELQVLEPEHFTHKVRNLHSKV